MLIRECMLDKIGYIIPIILWFKHMGMGIGTQMNSHMNEYTL